jgi:hypothetical protein
MVLHDQTSQIGTNLTQDPRVSENIQARLSQDTYDTDVEVFIESSSEESEAYNHSADLYDEALEEFIRSRQTSTGICVSSIFVELA